MCFTGVVFQLFVSPVSRNKSKHGYMFLEDGLSENPNSEKQANLQSTRHRIHFTAHLYMMHSGICSLHMTHPPWRSSRGQPPAEHRDQIQIQTGALLSAWGHRLYINLIHVLMTLGEQERPEETHTDVQTPHRKGNWTQDLVAVSGRCSPPRHRQYHTAAGL